MRFLVIGALLASTCFPTVVPEANSEFKPTGEVLLYNRSVSFDAVRVRSPDLNMTKRTDGSWGGIFENQALDVSVTDTKITGVNFLLTREMSDGKRTVITGQFMGRIYRFEFDDQEIMFRAPSKSMNYPGRQIAKDQTTYGPRGDVQLRGEAGIDNPPWPQIGFALMALMH